MPMWSPVEARDLNGGVGIARQGGGDCRLAEVDHNQHWQAGGDVVQSMGGLYKPPPEVMILRPMAMLSRKSIKSSDGPESCWPT